MRAVVSVSADASSLFSAIRQEAYANTRSRVSIRKKSGRVECCIEAEDPVALKAARTAWSNAVSIFRKMRSIGDVRRD